jgi:hypothetical protein
MIPPQTLPGSLRGLISARRLQLRDGFLDVDEGLRERRCVETVCLPLSRDFYDALPCRSKFVNRTPHAHAVQLYHAAATVAPPANAGSGDR